ncbi:hypothetical protein [Altericista sp. CCNU0014]|uniref:hypothetical protein n=1 Tax=Altericista sp. CCNU0014 TaxID=3082949 RepID=UPI003850270F
MSNAEQNPLDIYLRFAALERRVTKLESSLQEIDRIVDPQGWIGEAFNVLESHVDRRFDTIDHRLDSMDSKIDTILQHITGINRTND